MHSSATKPGTVTRRPSECGSVATLDSTGCSEAHEGDSFRSLLRDSDGETGEPFPPEPLFRCGTARGADGLDTVVDLGHVCAESGRVPPATCHASPSKPQPESCYSSAHSDQTDDITAESTTTVSTSTTEMATPTAQPRSGPLAIGDEHDAATHATVFAPKATMSLPFAPLPIDFPASSTLSALPPPTNARELASHSPASQRQPESDEPTASTPPLTYHTLRGPAPCGGDFPSSFSTHSTPTSHSTTGFPPSSSPTMWSPEAPAQSSSMSSSSFRHEDTSSVSPAQYYPTFTVSSPCTLDSRYVASPVSTPLRQISANEADRFTDAFFVDGGSYTSHNNSNVNSNSANNAAGGYGWPSVSHYERPYRSYMGGVASPLAYAQHSHPHGLTPTSLHEDGAVSAGSGWAPEPFAVYPASSTGTGGSGRFATSGAPLSPVLRGSPSPVYGPVSPGLSYAPSLTLHAMSLALPLSSEYCVVPERTSLIARLDFLSNVCQHILRDAAAASVSAAGTTANSDGDEEWWLRTVALDLEGRDLGRHGSVCIITLATVDCVYLIDMVELGAAALAPGTPLRRVLEAPHVTKLMYDCRADCDALFFLYNVRLAGVCDLQPAACHGLFPNSSHLPGMKDAFQRLGLLGDAERSIKEAGKTLFDPKSGGSFEHWEVRPLLPLLAKYCAVDVKYFFMARALLWLYLSAGYDVGQARITQVCEGRFENCCKGNALRDFL